MPQNLKQRTSDANKNELSSRRILIVLPINPITEWITAFDRVAPGVFKLYNYYGDSRSTKVMPVADEVSIQGTLHVKHELFDGKPGRARAVFIASIPRPPKATAPKRSEEAQDQRS